MARTRSHSLCVGSRVVNGWSVMSWKTINHIIGLASINPAFREQLQQDPQTALETEGFKLTPKEMDAFISLAPLPFTQFCRHLQETLAPEE